MLALAPCAVHAQSLLELRAQDSNGKLVVGRAFSRSPDDEYTNGARFDAVFAGSPLWGGLFGSRLTPCDGQAGDRACATTALSFGQDMYTPRYSFITPYPVYGQRPYAGWLYVSATARYGSARASNALTLEAGVTGEPSLANQLQNAVHRLFNYIPTLGWSHQIPFQPGFDVTYTHEQRIAHATIAGVPVLSVTPYVTGSAGNVLTGATAGLQGRVGYRVDAIGSPFSLYALGGVREDWVWRELVLDEGTNSDPSLRVTKVPWVNQNEIGAGIRLWTIEAEYRIFQRGREYVTGPAQHTYGLISLGMRTRW